jgi:hypothetical protein
VQIAVTLAASPGGFSAGARAAKRASSAVAAFAIARFKTANCAVEQRNVLEERMPTAANDDLGARSHGAEPVEDEREPRGVLRDRSRCLRLHAHEIAAVRPDEVEKVVAPDREHYRADLSGVRSQEPEQ